MVQLSCERCQAELAPGAAYCDRCGGRTRKARRMVGVAIRVELLFVVMVTILVLGFTYVFYVQR